jgi:glyoxylase-like metal-dependent hydrolase (beta-lactamase superfamily II)
LNEIAAGIYHWTAQHPDIHMQVSSYYVEPAGIVIDPLEPPDGMGFFDGLDAPPSQVVLTSGLHWRHADRFRDRYDATIRVVEAGMKRWEGEDRTAEPFAYGDEVAPGVDALEVDGICPDDTALHIRHGGGAIAFADGVTRMRERLAFVPDSLWDDPENEKNAVLERVRGLLDLDFEVLLFAHGNPLTEGAHAALEGFVDEPVTEPGLD